MLSGYVNVYPTSIYHHLEYEKVYLPLREVADTAFHIQGDDIFNLMMLSGYVNIHPT